MHSISFACIGPRYSPYPPLTVCEYQASDIATLVIHFNIYTVMLQFWPRFELIPSLPVYDKRTDISHYKVASLLKKN